jgi:hypothetical protein
MNLDLTAIRKGLFLIAMAERALPEVAGVAVQSEVLLPESGGGGGAGGQRQQLASKPVSSMIEAITDVRKFIRSEALKGQSPGQVTF